MLVLNCRSGGGASGLPRTCDPVSVASVTPHRVYNLPDASPRSHGGGAGKGKGGGGKEHWHVELEIQTLLVPTHHQGRGIGTVKQTKKPTRHPSPPTTLADVEGAVHQPRCFAPPSLAQVCSEIAAVAPKNMQSLSFPLQGACLVFFLYVYCLCFVTPPPPTL